MKGNAVSLALGLGMLVLMVAAVAFGWYVGVRISKRVVGA
jgi:hypothetical protein